MTESREVGRFGKLDPYIPKNVKRLDRVTNLPAPPAEVKHHFGLSFPIDGNDVYGDCVMAGTAHMIQAWNFETGVSLKVPSRDAVVAEYFHLTGGPDSGLVMSSTLNVWQQYGLFGNRIHSYAAVNLQSKREIQQATAFYGAAFIGFQVPQSANDQWSAGKPWTVVSGSKIIGGHAVPIVSYDANWLYCLTWGGVQPMSYDFYYTYADESWVVLSQEYMLAKYPQLGLMLPDLEADITSL